MAQDIYKNISLSDLSVSRYCSPHFLTAEKQGYQQKYFYCKEVLRHYTNMQADPRM